MYLTAREIVGRSSKTAIRSGRLIPQSLSCVLWKRPFGGRHGAIFDGVDLKAKTLQQLSKTAGVFSKFTTDYANDTFRLSWLCQM